MKFTNIKIGLFAVVADFISTQIALNRGYIEIHLNYSLINALIFILPITFLMDLILTKYAPRIFRYTTYIVSCLYLIGFINNSLVMLGVFGGLMI